MSFLERFKGKTSIMDKSGVHGIVAQQGQSIDKERVLADMQTDDSLTSFSNKYKKKNNVNEKYYETSSTQKIDDPNRMVYQGILSHANSQNWDHNASSRYSYQSNANSGINKYHSYQNLNNVFSGNGYPQNGGTNGGHELSHTVNLSSNIQGNKGGQHFYQRKDSAHSVNSAYSRLQNHYSDRDYGGPQIENFGPGFQKNSNYSNYLNNSQKQMHNDAVPAKYQFSRNSYNNQEQGSPTLIRQSKNILSSIIPPNNGNANGYGNPNFNYNNNYGGNSPVHSDYPKQYNSGMYSYDEVKSNGANYFSKQKQSNFTNQANQALDNSSKDLSSQNIQNQLKLKHQGIMDKISKNSKKQQYQ